MIRSTTIKLIMIIGYLYIFNSFIYEQLNMNTNYIENEKLDIQINIKTSDNSNNHELIINRLSFYNPLDPRQTDESPGICAWNYVYKPGDPIIAVSRDLIPTLNNGTKVRIFGLPEQFPIEYVVRDKMNSKWKNSIDIAFPFGDTLEKRKQLAKSYGVYENIKIEIIKET